MGEVYKARDLRLKRTVAIKVLSPELTRQADFLRRFEREAQTISSFNHPHICTLYDYGQQDGMHYLVLEYLEGQTLAERLRKGTLSLDEVLRYAIETADALGQAHKQGHVHRDLKPANLMLTRKGVKLLDFGIALALRAAPTEKDETLTDNLSTPGKILGTYSYMSPEQLQSREVDGRSDIFAFGAVLYEMVTGQKAFEGESPASVIAAVLEREPSPVSKTRLGMPGDLDWIVQTCLKKDPEERWQTMQDVRLHLMKMQNAPAAPEEGKAGSTNGRKPLWAALAGALVAAASLFAGMKWLGGAGKAEEVRFEVGPPSGGSLSIFTLASTSVPMSSVSPDGRRMAFVSERDGRSSIWVRDLAATESKEVYGTDGAQQPVWSPDGRSIAFFAMGKLRRIELAGGPPVDLCKATIDARGAAWLQSGTIVFAASNTSDLLRVPATGGQPEPVFKSAGEQRLRWWPWPLPDGNRFLYYDRRANGIFLGSLDGSAGKPLVESNWGALYDPRGLLLYLRGDTLMAQPLDIRAGQVTGEARPVALRVGGATNGMPSFSVSSNGVLSYAPVLMDSSVLTWHTRHGEPLSKVGEAGFLLDFRISPDSRRVALSRIDPVNAASDIWLHESERGTTTRFTSDPLLEASPIWSTDSSRVAYRSNRTGVIFLYMREVGTTGGDKMIFSDFRQLEAHGGSSNMVPYDWSRDGKHLIYGVPGNSGFDLYAVSMDGQAKITPLARTLYSETHGMLDAGSKWLAYASNETGRMEIYLQSFPEGKSRQQISAAGGTEPHWRADGRELYYITSDGTIMAVDIGANGVAGRPNKLFSTKTPSRLSPYRQAYCPTPDGQRFLVGVREGDFQPKITVALNWLDSLR
jgi:serine/threonine protein kinase